MSGNLHLSLMFWLYVVIWNIPSRSAGCQTFMWWELKLHLRTWTSNCTYNNNDLEVINPSLLFSYYCGFHICNDTRMLHRVERSLEYKTRAHHGLLDFTFISSILEIDHTVCDLVWEQTRFRVRKWEPPSKEIPVYHLHGNCVVCSQNSFLWQFLTLSDRNDKWHVFACCLLQRHSS